MENLERKLLIISKAVQKHGIRKLGRRIIVAEHEITELNVYKIDDITDRILQLERNWKRLREYLKQNGIQGTAERIDPDFRFKLRYINYLGMESILDCLHSFEIERFFEMMKLDAAIMTA